MGRLLYLDANRFNVNKFKLKVQSSKKISFFHAGFEIYQMTAKKKNIRERECLIVYRLYNFGHF